MLPAGLIGLISPSSSWPHGVVSRLDVTRLQQPASWICAGITNSGADVTAARWHTFFWAAFGIAMSMLATQMGSLIEAVNILGSPFYGPILGIFLVAFCVKKANGTDVFRGAILAEVIVVVL